MDLSQILSMCCWVTSHMSRSLELGGTAQSLSDQTPSLVTRRADGTGGDFACNLLLLAKYVTLYC